MTTLSSSAASRGGSYSLGLVVAVIFAIFGPRFWGQSDASIERSLNKAANDLNAQCPMMIDSETRLDRTIAGPGKKFTYLYTIMGEDLEPTDDPALWAEVRQGILNGLRSSPEMREMGDVGVSLVYQYKNEAGQHLGYVEFAPEEY
ncbi:MAG: hypothetical protein ACYTG5_08995 [Planctomycetota bacterium]|jgi:hypothetical protein